MSNGLLSEREGMSTKYMNLIGIQMRAEKGDIYMEHLDKGIRQMGKVCKLHELIED
jgi:hypothetical protein